MFFCIISPIFVLPIQFIQLVGGMVLPIDYAVSIIEILFCVIEVILAIKTMFYTSKKSGDVFYLRNTQTSIIQTSKVMKTSIEIEEELYENFPKLKQNSLNASRVSHISSKKEKNL
jgi:hypothetical protein